MRATLIFLVLLLLPVKAEAQGWRGIVPLRSDCDDVKQKLGLAECPKGSFAVPDANVSILFSEGTCLSGWNVPVGKVISIDVQPKVQERFSELNLDVSTYERIVYSLRPKRIRYVNNDKSVSVSVTEDGLVTNYFYGPSTKDESLRCSPKPGDFETGSVKFDEYGAIAKTEEEERLDNYASQLAADAASDGYILVYDGRLPSSNQARERGERAKAYLVRKGIEAKRLFLVEGGRREELTVELFVTIRGTTPPTPSPKIPRD